MFIHVTYWCATESIMLLDKNKIPYFDHLDSFTKVLICPKIKINNNNKNKQENFIIICSNRWKLH